MKRILVTEDDEPVAECLRIGLTDEHFEVIMTDNGEETLRKVHSCLPDLLLLDVKLPDIDGYEVCRRLRAAGNVILPILMLSARTSLRDKVAGLESGADDYMTKPFDFVELVARIHTRLRRLDRMFGRAQKIIVGDLCLNTATREVWRAEEPIELTRREYDLLELLARHRGQVLTKGQIFEAVWGNDNDADWEVIKVYVNYVRAKLNAKGKRNLIHAVRGVGYMLRP